MRFSIGVPILALAAAGAAAGCFVPPTTQPPPDEQQQTLLPLPYDLAWEAVNKVVKRNDLRVEVQDPNDGIIQASGSRFTLHDADCGKIKSIAGTYTAEPETDSTSVYNLLVRPRGKEATLVQVRATFNSAVKVPLRPSQDVDCVSHGIQESNLLRQVLVEAKRTHRPAAATAAPPPESPSVAASPARATTIGKPSADQHESAPVTPINPLGRKLPKLVLPDLPPPPKL